MQRNVLEYLEESAKRFPNKIAYTDENVEVTFSEFKSRAQSVAMQIYFWSGPFLILLGMAFCGMFTMNLGFMTNERLEKVMKRLSSAKYKLWNPLRYLCTVLLFTLENSWE